MKYLLRSGTISFGDDERFLLYPYESFVSYLSVFPEHQRSVVFGRLGLRPTLAQVARELGGLFGMMRLMEHVSLRVLGNECFATEQHDLDYYDQFGFAKTYKNHTFDADVIRFSTPVLRDVVFSGCYEYLRGFRSECGPAVAALVGPNPSASVLDEFAAAHPEFLPDPVLVGEPVQAVPAVPQDGYCYLMLYPQEMRADLACELGPWPTLSALPSGRFPAAVQRTVADFSYAVQGLLTYHCWLSPDGKDEMAALPSDAVVGGGSANVVCNGLTPSAPECADCARVSRPLRIALSREGCICDYRDCKFPTTRELDAMRDKLRIVRTDDFVIDWAFIVGHVPGAWQTEVACHSPAVRWVDDDAPAYQFIGFHRDEDGVQVLKVRGICASAVLIPVGSSVEFGPYNLMPMDNPVVLNFVGDVDLRCRSKDTGLMVRGFGFSGFRRLLHKKYGLDPSDVTARFAELADANLICSINSVRSDEQEWGVGGTMPVASRSFLKRTRLRGLGQYDADVGCFGAVVRPGPGIIARIGPVRVMSGAAALQVSPGLGQVSSFEFSLYELVMFNPLTAAAAAVLWIDDESAVDEERFEEDHDGVYRFEEVFDCGVERGMFDRDWDQRSSFHGVCD